MTSCNNFLVFFVICLRYQKFCVRVLRCRVRGYPTAAVRVIPSVFFFFRPTSDLNVTMNAKFLILISRTYHRSSVTNSRAEPQEPRRWKKHAHPPRVVYCAIYPWNTYSIHLVSSLKSAYFQGRLSRHTS